MLDGPSWRFAHCWTGLLGDLHNAGRAYLEICLMLDGPTWRFAGGTTPETNEI